MPEQALSFQTFPFLQPEAVNNDAHRPGTLLAEYHKVTFTVSSNIAEAEVPTALGEVLGVIGLGLMGTFATGDMMHGMGTDGTISSDAVTVRFTTVSIGDGSFVANLLLVGTKSSTVLLNSPNPS